MKKNIALILALIMLTSTLTGCDIKFIEKAPEKETTEDTSNQGNIDIDESDTDHFVMSTESDETSETTEDSSSEQSSETPVSSESKLEKNQQEINGVIFTMESREMYVTGDTNLYANANLSGDPVQKLTKGTKLVIKGVSLDESVAAVQLSSLTFMDYSKLSPDKPEEPSSTEETPPPSSETPSSETPPETTPTPSETTSQQPPETPTPPPQSSEEVPPPVSSEVTPPEPPQPQGGIPYPPNPYSTSVEFGITFADETFTATVINETTMNSGPGKAYGSTGYTVIDSFHIGTVVTCTGIGANGYIRIALADGSVGYILNTDLIRN